MSLLTIVPTRGRPEKVTALIKSFNDKTDGADLLFVIDPDDPSMEDFDFQGHSAMVLDPRGSMVQKLNYAAGKFLDDYDRMVWYADDNEFVTDHWDTLMGKTLDEMGGSGWCIRMIIVVLIFLRRGWFPRMLSGSWAGSRTLH